MLRRFADGSLVAVGTLFTVGWVWILVNLLGDIGYYSSVIESFVIGVGVASGLSLFGINSVGSKIHLFEHELSHSAAAVFTGGRLVEFHVWAERGEGMVRLSNHNRLITLAPYMCPLLALIVMGVVALFEKEPSGRSALIVGLLYGNYLTQTLKSFRSTQPDLRKAGLPLILAVVPAGNMASLLKITA